MRACTELTGLKQLCGALEGEIQNVGEKYDLMIQFRCGAAVMSISTCRTPSSGKDFKTMVLLLVASSNGNQICCASLRESPNVLKQKR
jgi:hypothetical protein